MLTLVIQDRMALNPALIYDPRYHTFDSWASLMVELYSPQQLSIPDETTDWYAWAEGLLAIDVFANEGAPNPRAFNDWQDWATALMNAVNPQTEI